jgi:hypothetical protein
METATAPTTTVAVRPAWFSPEEELALVGFLAGYGGLTREAYALDLRQYVAWCTEHELTVFGARRGDIETFGRCSKLSVGQERRLHAGCAPSRRSIATQKKKVSSSPRRPCTCAGRDWTTGPALRVWTATRSARCWSPPVSPALGTTH